MKNKVAGLLMAIGQPYVKQKLHRKKYFCPLLEQLPEQQNSVRELLAISRSRMELALRRLQELAKHALLGERVKRLQTIQGVGPVLALTWALEVGEPSRFPSIGEAVSYCGLCGAQKESAEKSQRGALSKQRNKHLQTMLIEAAKLAPLQRAVARSLPARVRSRAAQPRDAGGGAQAGGAFVGGRPPRARLRGAAAGGLAQSRFSLGDPPAGKTARGSLAWRKEKDVLLNDDELPAGPRQVGTARPSLVFPRRPLSLFRGRQVGPKLNLLRRLAARRWPEAAHGCLVHGAPRSIRKHSPRNGTTYRHPPAIEDGPRGLCVDPLTFTYHGCPYWFAIA